MRPRSPARRLRFLFALSFTLAALCPTASPAAGREEHLRARGEAHEAPEPGPIRRAPDAPPWPEGFEIGLQAARAYAFHFGLVEEDSVLARIHRIGYQVTSQAGRPDILFTFHILDVPDANAFALPGGFIFLTKGMVDLHLSDAALANLLGHEAAHVAGSHFGRAGRINTVLSLLQTAVVVAAVLAPSSGSSGGYDVEPETGRVRESLAGREAAIQGTSLFGGVFRELLLRGYSRGLEFEADDHGRRYAERAGYPTQGSTDLLEELHLHIYEDEEFGYWRTHPYFVDRLLRARAAARAGSAVLDSAQVAEYRRDVSERLAALASSVLDEPTSLFLYESALVAAPGDESSLEVNHRLLQIRAAHLRERKPVLRAYGPLVADYDSLLDLAGRARDGGVPPRDSAFAARARAERDSLDLERRELREGYGDILSRPNAGTPFLELFLENYPGDPEAPAVRLRLAERYRLSERPDEAAIQLAELHEPDWTARMEAEMRLVLPLARELTTSQKILLESRSDSVRAWAARNLEIQIEGLDSLEVGSRFLQQYPEAPATRLVIAKLEELAMNRYRQARLREGMQDYQAALDEYNELILLAPGTKAAGLARDGITRIQATAGG